MLVAFAGLPGSGKSYLVHALCESHPGMIVFDKDVVRATLFPDNLTDYTSGQDDLCMEIILKAAGYLIAKNPDQIILLDGRTFSKKTQVDMVVKAAEAMHTPCKFILLTCSDTIAKKRLAEGQGVHLAQNRNADLYLSLKQKAEPLSVTHLALQSDDGDVSTRVRAVWEYIQA